MSPSASVAASATPRAAAMWGLAWYVVEALQLIGLIPFYAAVLGPTATAGWLTVASSAGLVALAYAGYYQPLIRNIASSSRADSHGSTPANWPSLRRRTGRLGAGSLLLLQVVFVCAVATLGSRFSAVSLVACALYFIAMQFRLAAYQHFALLNGLRQISQDKIVLLIASMVTSALLLALGSTIREAWALGAAILIGSALMYALASSATRRLPIGPVPVPMPNIREMVGLMMLSGAGYLNIGTDVVMGTQLLPAAMAVDYAFWSRVLFIQLAVVALWAQLRFPFWSGALQAMPELRRSAWRVAGWLGLTGSALFVIYVAATATLSRLPLHQSLSETTMLAMSANAFAAAMTVALGQMLMARSAYRFVRPSIAVACLAPLLAWWAGSASAPTSFVWGYLAVNLALMSINLFFFLMLTRNGHTHSP